MLFIFLELVIPKTNFVVSTLYFVGAGNVLIHPLYTSSDEAFTNDA